MQRSDRFCQSAMLSQVTSIHNCSGVIVSYIYIHIPTGSLIRPEESKSAFLTRLTFFNLSNLIWRFYPLRNPRFQVAVWNLLRTSSRRRSPFQGHLSDEYQKSALQIVSESSTQVANLRISWVQRLIPIPWLTIRICLFPNTWPISPLFASH